MKTSVVISAYNGKRYIIEQLESIRQQSQPVDEVLIADDCSTDGTPELVQAYIDQHHLAGWHVEVNTVNKGWRRNFMEAMWASTGDVVFSCDQDDLWHPDKVKLMTATLTVHPEISLLTSNYDEFFPDGKHRLAPWPKQTGLFEVPLKRNYMLVKAPGCTYAIRRSLLDVAKKYWQPDYPHDALLWRLSQFNHGLYALAQPLLRWRKHETSAFAKESKDLKTIEAKQAWIKVANAANETLREYVRNEVPGDTRHQQAILARTSEWLKRRQRFYDAQKIVSGLALLPYWSSYPRIRQYPGDWYLIFIKKK
ncbi:glycosyltransferase [Limosilactobacillus ingluviei]|uniref:glycosyltransferase n=1 Tax=Limosilactobacillus ingluviei TaxID=148604 RepID=UPI0024B91B9B|nr:glycosyltransferase [Limosilactobacillus ingluviei]